MPLAALARTPRMPAIRGSLLIVLTLALLAITPAVLAPTPALAQPSPFGDGDGDNPFGIDETITLRDLLARYQSAYDCEFIARNTQLSMRVSDPGADARSRREAFWFLAVALKQVGLGYVPQSGFAKPTYTIEDFRMLAQHAYAPVASVAELADDACLGTLVIRTRYVDLNHVQRAIISRLSLGLGSAVVIDGVNPALVVTDYRDNLAGIEELIAVLDVASEGTLFQTVELRHGSAHRCRDVIESVFKNEMRRGLLHIEASSTKALFLRGDSQVLAAVQAAIRAYDVAANDDG